MQDELLEMQAKLKKTIIFITHDLNESLRLGDRMAIMKDGEVVQIGTGEEILTQPADEYVKRFVEDVNRAKVLTAENIMDKPKSLILEETTASAAKAKMEKEDLSNMLVENQKGHLIGYVLYEDVVDTVAQNQETIQSMVHTDIPIVGRQRIIDDLFRMSQDSSTPIAVVEEGKLVGVIVRSHIIGALAKEGEVSTKNE